MNDCPEGEIGKCTGLPLDLPFGRHPFDWYIAMLENLLGHHTTARYLGQKLDQDKKSHNDDD